MNHIFKSVNNYLLYLKKGTINNIQNAINNIREILFTFM